jgi:putative transcriptional regulator
VQAIRRRVGGTQAEFAALIGVPPGTLRNWEHRRRQPTGSAFAPAGLQTLANQPIIA